MGAAEQVVAASFSQRDGSGSKLPSSTAAAKITQQTFGAAWLTRTGPDGAVT